MATPTSSIPAVYQQKSVVWSAKSLVGDDAVGVEIESEIEIEIGREMRFVSLVRR